MKPEDVVDESSLDPEALQAQIDLSMSFAQDLVSSWLDPSKFSKSSRKQDLEKELTDYMRRPPRLGVGATVPAGHQASMSRETARLKGKLAGTKRPREEEASTSKLPSNHDDDDDDEGESKAHAIKKKAKVDPFDVVHGKKKKKQKHSTQDPPTPINRSTPAPPDEDSSGEVADLLLQSPTKSIVNDVASTTSSPKKPKKKKKKGSKDRSDKSNASALPASDSEAKPEDEEAHHNAKSAHEEATSADSVLGTPHSSPKKKGSLDMSKIPLLNLTGPPPSDDDSGDEAEGASATSPKKKRRRRKKKKIAISDSNENAVDVDDA